MQAAASSTGSGSSVAAMPTRPRERTKPARARRRDRGNEHPEVEAGGERFLGGCRQSLAERRGLPGRDLERPAERALGSFGLLGRQGAGKDVVDAAAVDGHPDAAEHRDAEGATDLGRRLGDAGRRAGPLGRSGPDDQVVGESEGR